MKLNIYKILKEMNFEEKVKDVSWSFDRIEYVDEADKLFNKRQILFSLIQTFYETLLNLEEENGDNNENISSL